MSPVLWLECHRCRLLTVPLDLFFFGAGLQAGVALHAVVLWWREQERRETELARRLRAWVTSG